jgi:hypothetical protein
MKHFTQVISILTDETEGALDYLIGLADGTGVGSMDAYYGFCLAKFSIMFCLNGYRNSACWPGVSMCLKLMLHASDSVFLKMMAAKGT